MRLLQPTLRLVLLLAFGSVLDAATPPSTWRKVVTPNFVVITTADERTAVACADEFSQFIESLQRIMTVDPARLPKLTIVLFSQARDFLPCRPLTEDGRPQPVAGFFSGRDSWSVAGLSGARLDSETRRTFFHEGTHWFLYAFELPNPVWLEEGLAEVFSTFEIEKETVAWGRPIERHVELLQSSQPMPLERLLFLARSDLFKGGTEGSQRTGLAYAESWAFVHFVLFGKTEMPANALPEYTRLLRETHPDIAFERAFGRTYAKMDEQLQRYIQNGSHYLSHRAQNKTHRPRAEPATEAEVEDALARLMLVGGRRDTARKHVANLMRIAPDSPAAYEILGQICLEDQQPVEAVAAFEQAIGRKSQEFRCYFEVAAARHRAAADGDGLMLAPGAARKIANDYERAINLNPRFEPAYASLAAVLELVPPGNENDAEFLELGHRLFPDNGMIRLGLAVLDKKAGREDAAMSRLNDVLTMPDAAPNVRSYARRLEAGWLQSSALAEVESLTRERKFGDALTIVDRQLAVGGDMVSVTNWREMRRGLVLQQHVDQVRRALEAQEWGEARRLLTSLAESEAPAGVKSQARRQLDQLDRERLGAPAENEKSAGAAAQAP